MAYVGVFASDGTTPVTTLTTALLNATENTVGGFVKLVVKAVRDDAPAEIQLQAGSEVALSGATADKWQLAPDDEGNAGTPSAYGAPLPIASVVRETGGVPVWVRAKATSGEAPQNDPSVDITVTGIAVAV